MIQREPKGNFTTADQVFFDILKLLQRGENKFPEIYGFIHLRDFKGREALTA